MIKVGVFFGGASREREVSFAGGRTVYDNLDKEKFHAVPIFIDAFGNFIRLDWQFIYRGTIRDFFPPASHLPKTEHAFQLYSESLDLSKEEYNKMLTAIGEPLSIEQLVNEVDVAFLALHGNMGEDGKLQGLLEWFDIPYTGSGVLASALGVSKHIQKRWWPRSLNITKWNSISLEKWKKVDREKLLNDLNKDLGLPFVAKSSNQGSSIGVQVIQDNDLEQFIESVNSTFFIEHLKKKDWESLNKVKYIQELTDLRIGLGLPILCEGELIHHPETLMERLNHHFKTKVIVELQAQHGEYEVIFEEFLEGREFSCIVVVDDNGEPIALPPTEVVKGNEIFDYNSKYLPGLSHKQTPIKIEDDKIDEIRSACVELFSYFGFEVYARIDGFINKNGVFLNDPNTTSGMMPSSFFFHQAAEIGLDPKEFITYILRNSIAERMRKSPSNAVLKKYLGQIDEMILSKNAQSANKKKVAVVFGGYSTERHISVESGRNIYEKLSSSAQYIPTPIFLSGADNEHRLFEIPINIMLKDNADDIKSKLEQKAVSKALLKIREEAKELSKKYGGEDLRFTASELSYDDLADRFDEVFIALHGRPGEDGQVQKELDLRHVPYNGSGVKSSQMTINKFETNRILRENGFLVADSALIHKNEWIESNSNVLQKVKSYSYPLICKPHDEGCSSAVIKIENEEMFSTYADLCFNLIERTEEVNKILDLGAKDEFPSKDQFMVETFTKKGDADHFIEITGGMLTHLDNGEMSYEVFEPSEALSSGTVLSLAEKFLAGEGQNITPARYSSDPKLQSSVSKQVRTILEGVARTLNVEGYCRIDAFVRVYKDKPAEVVIIEINSLPGMTPATCIYHQAAINNYKPYQFIDKILEYGVARTKSK